MEKKSIVKIDWTKNKTDWYANLVLASKEGFKSRSLEPGENISFEITDKRRCTGYSSGPGERTPCPNFRQIENGSQCSQCRKNDVHIDYIQGRENNLDGSFSVYMAQIGSEVKVGVTREEKIPKRWIEQGADYGAEIESGLSSNIALKREEELTKGNVKQRIRKESKVSTSQNGRKLKKILESRNLNTDIIPVQSLTAYPDLKGTFARKGLIEGEIESIKGQIISNGRIAMGMTFGKVLKKPSQKGLNKF